MKSVIVIVLVLVVAVLASAGFIMVRKGDAPRDGRDPRMMRALALRVALSIALFLFILLGWHFGWIHPTGLPVGQ